MQVCRQQSTVDVLLKISWLFLEFPPRICPPAVRVRRPVLPTARRSLPPTRTTQLSGVERYLACGGWTFLLCTVCSRHVIHVAAPSLCVRECVVLPIRQPHSVMTKVMSLKAVSQSVCLRSKDLLARCYLVGRYGKVLVRSRRRPQARRRNLRLRMYRGYRKHLWRLLRL